MSDPSAQNSILGSPQFELKAGAFTLPLLRLLGTNMAVIAQQLSSKVDQAESFFHNAPVVIDLKEVADEEIDFPILVGLMRGHGMIPVGVRGGSMLQNEAAEVLDLAVLADGRASRSDAKQPQLSTVQTKTQPLTNSTTLVTRPVRSGQRVYAQGGDLVVLGQVSSGAEVMADGHIHVYASLRGRALAGLKGNQDARIFCQDLRAELVSVAGHYRISENIDTRMSGRPVQVYLEERILRIDLLQGFT